jgi:malonyl-ACP O-methyltransferase BioC
MIDKKRLKVHFSNAVKSYEKYAVIQKKISEKTFQVFSDKKYKNIFEIGSGTGFLSEKLKTICKGKLTALDLSEEMNKKLKTKIKNIETITKDIEKYDFEKKYNLITSSSTLQWISDKETVIQKSLSALEKNGKIVFSFFNKNTFQEFRDVYKKVTKRQFLGTPGLLTEIEIDHLALKFSAKVHHEIVRQEIKSLLSFFHELKAIGANNSSEVVVLSPSVWKKIFKEYDETFVENGKIYISYGISYLEILND